jgi:polysaccharide pyruvyl transferase WcaK-like protein
MIKKINIPVLVNAMGYHEYEETTEEHVGKFRKFLEIISKQNNWFISVRNDGSHERMKERYSELMDKIITVPDAGFFFNPSVCDRLGLSDTNTTWIGMNITNELFNETFNKGITSKDFNASIAGFIDTFLKEKPECNIILFPHANHDIPVISEVLGMVTDVYKRERIVLAPLVVSGKSVEYMYDLYRLCACIIGMRFHSNVCAIAMNVPSIGLAGHEQVVGLYNELGLPERCLNVDTSQFGKNLFALLEQTLDESAEVKKEYAVVVDRLNNESDMYIRELNEWILSVVL